MRKLNDATDFLGEDSLIDVLYRAHAPALFAFPPGRPDQATDTLSVWLLS